MRIAAWTLTIAAGLACAWCIAVAGMLVFPGGRDLALHDPFDAVEAARLALPLTALALLNGTGALLLYRKRRPGALWLVLGAGLLALGVAVWYWLAAWPDIGRVPSFHFDVTLASDRDRAIVRRLVGLAALLFTFVGWLAWLVNRRITIGHGRD